MLAVFYTSSWCYVINTICTYRYVERYNLRMGKIINSNTIKCQQGCGEIGSLIHGWWECVIIQMLWKSLAVFLKNKHASTIQHSNCHPGIYPKERKTYIHTKTCSGMLIVTLFIRAKTTDYIAFISHIIRCVFGHEWLNKLWYICIVEYCSAVTKE